MTYASVYHGMLVQGSQLRRKISTHFAATVLQNSVYFLPLAITSLCPVCIYKSENLSLTEKWKCLLR